MPTNDGFSGVSNCYVFKSRLQEYAQKVGISTPVYQTIKEGPSHVPCFRSTVIVNDVKYDSLPGFFNRKAAEQSAAEVALMELTNSGEVNECISQPIHETGLCKNLLQEYAQKMNYAIPMYHCNKDEAPGRVPRFSCTVDIGGMRYIGAAAKTKKESEIKAARTALLAIQSSASEDKLGGNSQFTVIPCKKRGLEPANNPEETANVPKAKKARFKRNMLRRKLSGKKLGHNQVEKTGNSNVDTHDQVESKFDQTDASGVMSAGSKPLATETMSFQGRRLDIDPSENEKSAGNGVLVPHIAVDSQNGHMTDANSNQSNHETPHAGTSCMSCGEITGLAKGVNELTGVGEVASVVKNNSTLSQIDASSVLASSVVAGVNQPGERIQAGAIQG